MADPSNPVLLGSYSATDKLAFAVAAYGDSVYLSEFADGVSGGTLRVLDISDPSPPTSLRSQSLPDMPYHFRVLEGRLIAANDASISLWSLANPREPQLLDTQTAAGRVCAVDGGNIVVSGRVFRPDGNRLVEVARFTAGQGQAAGFPYGSAIGSGSVFLTQSLRVLILQGVAPPEAWRCQVRLPLVRNR